MLCALCSSYLLDCTKVWLIPDMRLNALELTKLRFLWEKHCISWLGVSLHCTRTHLKEGKQGIGFSSFKTHIVLEMAGSLLTSIPATIKYMLCLSINTQNNTKDPGLLCYWTHTHNPKGPAFRWRVVKHLFFLSKQVQQVSPSNTHWLKYFSWLLIFLEVCCVVL